MSLDKAGLCYNAAATVSLRVLRGLGADFEDLGENFSSLLIARRIVSCFFEKENLNLSLPSEGLWKKLDPGTPPTPTLVIR